MQRRDYLKALLATAIVAPTLGAKNLFAQESVQAYTVDGDPIPTILWVARNGEEAMLDYSTEEGFKAISWFLRDVKANQVGVPHTRLLQLLSWMQAWLAENGYHVRLDFHSGLRTIWTNNHTENAAKSSYHLADKDGVFKAADLSIKSIPSNYIGQLAKYAGQGGVGFYPSDNFTHADTGPVGRTWQGRPQVKRITHG